MPLTILISTSEYDVEVEVIRARRYRINGIDTYECLVRMPNGELDYAYASEESCES